MVVTSEALNLDQRRYHYATPPPHGGDEERIVRVNTCRRQCSQSASPTRSSEHSYSISK